MLRSFDQIRAATGPERIITAGERYAILTGSGLTYHAPWHWHDCLTILLPSAGAMRACDEAHPSGSWVSEERFIVLPRDQPHETQAVRERHAHLTLYLTDDGLAQVEAECGSLASLRRRVMRPTQFASTPEIRAIQALCRSGQPDDASMRAARRHLAAAMMIHCLSCIERADPSPAASADAHGDMIVTEIKAFIDARIADALPLDLIAETFGLSRRHATRLFRERTGLSIARHHERRRVERARELLSETTLPIGEIAHRVGFESGSSLARVMRRVAGVAPGDVRRMARSDAS